MEEGAEVGGGEGGGVYPCFLGSSWLHKDEMSVGEAESTCYELSRLVVLPQQHPLYLQQRETYEVRGATNPGGAAHLGRLYLVNSTDGSIINLQSRG